MDDFINLVKFLVNPLLSGAKFNSKSARIMA